MKRKHEKTLELIFHRPISGNIQWRDIEALFVELGAEISEREGSRVLVSEVIGPRPQIAPKKQHFPMCFTRHGEKF